MTLTLINEEERPERIAESLKKIEIIDYADNERAHLLQREGAQAVDQLIDQFTREQAITDLHLAAHVLMRLQDMQVRDYAMGITSEANIETLWSLWRSVIQIAPAHYIAPVAALFSATCYEMGDMPMALRALDRALDDDSKYPMAKLLRRVYAAGWPPTSFRAMREELHPKVCASLGVASDS